MNSIQSQLLASALDQGALASLRYGQKRDAGAGAVHPWCAPSELAAAGVLGGLAYIALAPSMKELGLYRSNIAWNVISSIMGVAVGTLVFEEKLDATSFAGIGLGVAAIYLLSQ